MLQNFTDLPALNYHASLVYYFLLAGVVFAEQCIP